MSKQELRCRVKGKSGDEILEVNCQVHSETFLRQSDSMICMTVKDLKVTYPIMSEERTRYGSMKLPCFTIRVKYTRSKDGVSCLSKFCTFDIVMEFSHENGLYVLGLRGQDAVLPNKPKINGRSKSLDLVQNRPS